MPKKNTNKNKKLLIIVGVVVGIAGLVLASSYSGFLGTNTFLSGLSGPKSSPIGYFRFSNDRRIDQTNLTNAYVRVGVSAIMDANGNITFDPDGTQRSVIAGLIADGKRVVPTIRVKVSETAKCDSAPKDLDRTSPLKPGTIYSQKLKVAVHAFAQENKGKFPIVVFGNEQNAEGFFCATNKTGGEKNIERLAASDYIRMLSTAKKAYQEKDPKVKFADGGIQGQTLAWLIVDEHLKKGDVTKARHFYKQFMEEAINEPTLRDRMASVATQQGHMRGESLIALKLYSFVDLANFHHYQPAESLAEIDKFIRVKSGGKPRITNEIGIKKQFGESSRNVAMKYFELASYGYQSIIWFTNEGDDGNNGGAFVDDSNNIIPRNVKAFEMMAKYLGRPYSNIRNLSTDSVGRVVLKYSNGSKVDVLWPIGVSSISIPTLGENCKAFTHLGDRIPANRQTSDAPVYIVCESSVTPTASPAVTTTPNSPPTVTPGAPIPPNTPNRAPVATVKMSVDDGETYSTNVTVTQNKVVRVRLTAGEHGSNGSYDPDGWDTPGKGVSVGGKCEWNSDLNVGQPTTYETTKRNPQYPTSCDIDLGPKKFTLAPGTYTYRLLKITDAAGAVATSAVQFTVVADPNPNANRPPLATAKMSVDGGDTYSTNVTVTQNEFVNVRLSAGEKGSDGSYDPDGWDHPEKGVSSGGKIEWNSDLNLGSPTTYETTTTNPASPSHADINLGRKKFTLAPGTYTYNLLKITDAAGAVSNIGAVTLTVLPATPQ